MKVVVNTGHGGGDPGAVNKSLNVTEHDYCTKLTAAVVSSLRKLGHTAEIVVQDKRGVGMVAGACNAMNPDVVVSLHNNAAENLKATGTETLYWHTSTNGKRLAEAVQKRMVAAMGLPDRGVKARDNLAVLRSTKAVAIIVEPFFISNDGDYGMAVSKLPQLADAIAQGINDWQVAKA
jgi:N-acetylmuramoyl-L-alanine amidase